MTRGTAPPVVTALLVVAALLGACTSTGPAGTDADASPSPGSPVPAPEPTGGTGAAGEQEPAPQETAPPERIRFAGRISEIPRSLAAEMRGTTWKPGCPVPIDALRLLRFNYWGFDGRIERGPMVVNASVAENVLGVFELLFDDRFPMKRVGLAREFRESRLETDPHTRRSVTASFNCRVVVTPAGAGDEFSQHSYGLAIDVNPLQNPYVREDGWVRNRFAKPYVDRSRDLQGMIHEGDLIVRAFAEIGWKWGGHWSGGKDYMHFSLLER